MIRLTPQALLFWTSVACCLVAQVLIVRSVLAARRLPEPRPDVPRSPDVVEVTWALVPAVALAALLFFTWHAIEAREAPRAAPSVVTAR